MCHTRASRSGPRDTLDGGGHDISTAVDTSRTATASPPTPETVHTPTAWDWALVAGPGTIWGTSFLFIAEGLHAVGPNGVTFLRVLIGFLTLSLIPGVRKPVARADRFGIVRLGIVWVAFPLSMFPFAEQHVSSALTGMLNGATPLFAAIVASAFARKAPERAVIIGLGVGLSGAVMIALPSLNALIAMTYAERAAQPCIGHERADLVLAGCAILEALLRIWPCQRLRVADRGLREGILATLMAEDGHDRRSGPRRNGDRRPPGLARYFPASIGAAAFTGCAIGRARAARLAPASLGSLMKMSAELAASAATIRKASGKSPAFTAAWSRPMRSNSRTRAPMATPADSESCCATLAKLVARLMRLGIDIRIGERVDARELQRAEEAARQEQQQDHAMGRRRREERGDGDEEAAQNRIDDEDAAEAEAAQDRRGRGLHGHGADARLRRSGCPDWNGVRPKPSCKHQRQQEGHARRRRCGRGSRRPRSRGTSGSSAA